MDAIHANLNYSDHEIALKRTKFLSKWTARAKQLVSVETALKNSMDPVVANAVAAKRILLFEEMLVETKFPDLSVVDELKYGANLVGEVASTGMLPGKLVPALSTVDELSCSSKRIRSKVENDRQGSGDKDVDNQFWEKTMEEVSKGWLIGPLASEEVPDWQPISRRFGLLQKKGKLRLIDDYSESGVNSCVTAVESPLLHTVDIACAVLVLWFHACVAAKASPELLARTFDLKSAYRQVGLSPDGRNFSCLRVFDPSVGKVRLFRSVVLPFGAIRSVHSFLRLSRAIWWIGTVGCQFMWTSFYDDFISFSKPCLASKTEMAACSLFKLLGWAFAESGDKCMPFAQMCEALGVAFKLDRSVHATAFVCNTVNRVEELCADLTLVLETGSLSSKNAQRLRGRMQFADGQLFARTGKRCLKAFGDFAEGRRFQLLPKDRLFINLFATLLKQNTPREIRSLDDHNMVIFTDACYERDSASWPCGLGGVFFFQMEVQFFSLQLNAQAREALGELCRKQIIFETETLAAVIAFQFWSRRFENRRCVLFVDNEGTKFSLLRGVSENKVVDSLAERFVELESKLHAFIWLARVPSHCNVADAPSRGETDGRLLSGALDVSEEATEIMWDLVSHLPQMGKPGCDSIPSGKRKRMHALV